MDVLNNLLESTGNILINNIIPLIIVLGIMIFFHELGHFLVAKYFNVKVLKFALGFGPRIISRDYGETEYSIRYLPLGGFVKMLGENDFDEDAEPVDEKDADRAFNVQHPLKRIAIVAAGPVFNLVLAFFLLFVFYIFIGKPVTPADPVIIPQINEVIKDSPAEKAGLKKGDIIISLEEKNIEKSEDVSSLIKDKAGIPVKLIVMRGDERLTFFPVPEESNVKEESGEYIKKSILGVFIAYITETEYEKINPPEAFKEALSSSWEIIKLTCLVVVKLLQGTVSIKTVGGPIMIGQMTGQIVQQNIGDIIPFMAIISINLGILNLLPIPILDGGVILFLFFELVMRKPVSMNKREFAMKIGLSLLLLLMAVVFYNDILRLFTK